MLGRLANPVTSGTPPPPREPLANVVVTEEQIIPLDPVHFDVASAVLRSDSFAVIDQVARAMAEHPAIRVRVEGHTDPTGRDAENPSLSEERARAVVVALVGRGVDEKRLRAVGFRSSRPVAHDTNPDGSDNPAGRELNRRTEFHIES